MTPRILADISDFIFVADEPAPVDAIFLPGGSYPQPAEYAAALYRDGLARWLIPSGGVSVKLERWPGVKARAEIYDGAYCSDCEFYTDVLRKNGVPADAIIGEARSGHTRDNAFLSREAVDAAGIFIRSAMIVCKAFHARRCLMLYQLAFPEAALRVCPVHCYGITRDNWHESDAGVDRVLGELARCGGQFAGDVMAYLNRKRDRL